MSSILTHPQCVNTDSGNGLVLNKWQTIIWNQDELVHCYMYNHDNTLCATGPRHVKISPRLSPIWSQGQWMWVIRTLTHWGLVTHICVNKVTTIDADNGLSPGQRQTIIWANAEILLIGPLGTNFSEILVKIQTFSFRKMHLKMSSGKWRPFCLGLNVLSYSGNLGEIFLAIYHSKLLRP